MVYKLEEHNLSLDRLYEMDAASIERLARQPRCGKLVKDCVHSFPYFEVKCDMQPITRTVLRVCLKLTPQFRWREGMLGGSTRWLIWVEDSDNEHIYHSEEWTLTKRMHQEGTQTLAFTIPIFEPLPSQVRGRRMGPAPPGGAGRPAPPRPPAPPTAARRPPPRSTSYGSCRTRSSTPRPSTKCASTTSCCPTAAPPTPRCSTSTRCPRRH